MIKIGCCGFPIKKENYFKKLSLVEIQSTFYQIPEKLTFFEKLRKKAPPNFEFTLKAFQIITHEFSSPTYKKLNKKIGETKNYGFFKNTREVFLAWQLTKKVAEILKAKIILFQCPPSFLPTIKNIENLEKFFKKIKEKKFIFALELRKKWPQNLLKKLGKKLNLIHCVDPFKEKPLFGKINYFRLHGKPGYNLHYTYNQKDLKEILNFCHKRLNYVLFNNFSMLKDAQKLKKLLTKHE